VVFVLVAASLIVAMFLARGTTWRWVLALIVIAFIVPRVGSTAWDTKIEDPAFISSGAYRHYLTPGENVLTIPVLGPNERWQAETGFYFNLAAGYAATVFPSGYEHDPTWNTLLSARLAPGYAAQLRRFVHDKRVSAIIIDHGYLGPWRKLFGTLGVRPIVTGGVTLYRLKPT